MHTDRQKVILDYDILKWINEHYSFSLKPELHIEKECFSAPDLDQHTCCVYAKLPGDTICKGCGHMPGRLCPITCKIHHFCLAAYAYRLGIGGDDQNKAITENLKLGYKKLYDKVQDVLTSMEGEESTRIMSVQEIDGKLPPQSTIDRMAKEAEEQKGEEMPQKPTEEVVPLVEGVVIEEPVEEKAEEMIEIPEKDMEPPEKSDDYDAIDSHMEVIADETDPLLTVQEAADLWGCTYANIFHKIKSGALLVETVDKRKMVRKSDILRLKSKRSKRGRKAKK